MSKHTVTTERLLLMSATPALLEADMAGPGALAELLGASVPNHWPPGELADIRTIFRQQLVEDADLEGWLLWYWLARRGEPDGLVLVGAGGFAGKPDGEGCVRLGCAIAAGADPNGYTLEAFNGLIRWALQDSTVSRVLVPGSRQE